MRVNGNLVALAREEVALREVADDEPMNSTRIVRCGSAKRKGVRSRTVKVRAAR